MDVLSRAQNRFTALIYASDRGHADCVRLLLDAGADKNAKGPVRASRSLRLAIVTMVSSLLCIFIHDLMRRIVSPC